MGNKALIVGIDYMDGTKYHLTTCVNDAKDMCTALSRNYDGSINFSIQTLINSDAKYTALKYGLESLFLGDEADTVLFYFAGHGSRQANDVFLLPYDFSDKTPGISLYDLLCMAAKCNARSKVIILDSCMSGSFGTCDLVKDLSFLPNNTVVLSACSARGSAYDLGKDTNGVFTSLIKEALIGGAEDIFGNVTTESLYSYIEKALDPWDQRPYYKANISKSIVLKKNKPSLTIQELTQAFMLFSDKNSHFKLIKEYADYIKEYTQSGGGAIVYDEFRLLNKLYMNRLLKTCNPSTDLYEASINEDDVELTMFGKYYYDCILAGKL